MIPQVMGYTIAISLLFALAGYGLDRVGLPVEGSKRWIWATAMLLSLVFPAAVLLRTPHPLTNLAPAHEERIETITVPKPALVPAATEANAVPSGHSQINGQRWRSGAALDLYLGALWAGSCSALALWLLIGRIALYRRTLGWPEERVDGHVVRISEDTGPGVVGFWKPFIILPRWVLRVPAETRSLVLRHEALHLAARDPRLVLFGLILVLLTPWNLPLWWQLRRLRFALEIDCDARVRRGGANLSAYAEMLLTVCERSSRIPVGALAMSARRSELERRVMVLMVTASRPRFVTAGAIVATVLLVACATQVPAPEIRAPATVSVQAPTALLAPSAERRPAAVSAASVSSTRQTGVIEDIVSTEEGAYRSTAYVVTWHGARVLVADPLNGSSKIKGDKLDFLVIRSQTVEGKHLLGFISLQRRSARSAPRAPRSEHGSTKETTGAVKEVLSAQDGDYRFVAYIARLGKERVAVWDALAESHYSVGDVVPILELRGATPAVAYLHFQIDSMPQAAGKASAATAVVVDAGVVERTLSAASQGYAYRAYVVRWHASELVVDDPTAASDYQVGDRLAFRIRRVRLPSAGGVMQLELQKPPSGPADENARAQTSSVTDTAVVERVLSSQDGADRAVAYLVRWHGVPVAVTDEFATTHFAAGERIKFEVVRENDDAVRRLLFMMWVFPNMPVTHTSLTP